MVCAISVEAVWAGGAIVVAALITFIGVRLQTSKTLKGEHERLQEQLEAEQARLQTQLAHDRTTREREELRALLDAAATCMDELAFLTIQATGAAEEVSKVKVDSESDLEDAVAPLEAKLEESFALIRKVDGYGSRIGMRLGTDHPVRIAYKEARDSLSQLHSKLYDLEVPDNDNFTELMRDAGRKAGQFEHTASLLIRSELSDGSPPGRKPTGEGEE